VEERWQLAEFLFFLILLFFHAFEAFGNDNPLPDK